jgi:hypothetical protein
MSIRILLVALIFILPLLIAFWLSPEGSDLPLIVLAIELLPLIGFMYWAGKQTTETGAGRRSKKISKSGSVAAHK